MKLTKKLPLLVSSTLFLICCFLPNILWAQTPGCGTDDVQQELFKRNPSFQKKQKEAESITYKTLKQQYKNKRTNSKSSACGDNNEEIYRIPIVVHVMHLPQDSLPGLGSNLSVAQVQAGIDHLNQAFRNEGSYAGGPYYTSATSFGVQSEDVKIQFVLAKRDPSGNASDGINRISTPYSNLAYADDGPSGGTQDAYLKSLSYWNSQDYTNVWLVNEICKYEPDSICGVAGYAYLAGAHGASYDGIVNEARYWGSSANASKVHIHEVGHYLNLYHTFNDPDGSGSKSPCENGNCLTDGDYVCDTPADNSSSAVSCYSASTANSCSTDADDTSSNNPFTTDVDDMYENYMDYGYQSCQNTFTQGQKDRMRLALTTIRASLLDSDGLTEVNVADAELANILSPKASIGCENFTPTVTLKSKGDIALSSAKIAVSIDGVFNHVENWSGNLASGASEAVSLQSINSTTGEHNLSIYLQEINGSSADADSHNDTVSLCFSIYTSTSNFPYCQDFETAPNPPENWTESNTFGTNLWANYSVGTGCSTEYGNTSYYLDNWYSTYGSTGADVDFQLVSLDLTNLTEAKFSFAHAYARSYSSRALELEVAISTDCGTSFQTLETWNNNQLATTSSYEYSTAWAPQSCDDWANDTLDLSSYSGETISIRFRSKIQAYYAQNLYLDNICLTGISNSSCENLDLDIGHQDETCNQGNGTAIVEVASGTAPYTYSWNTQPVQSTATATSLSTGSHQVIVTDSAGCQDSATVSIQNTGNLPTAGFSYQTQDLTLTFSNTGSSDLAASYAWDLGDGNTSTSSDPIHTYSSEGVYTVCLYINNSCGADTLCQQVTIDCPLPRVSYNHSINDLQVNFHNGTSDADSYRWDFGDGNTSSDEKPSHAYTTGGTYTVCLTATNSCGSDSTCQQITVSCPDPTANFGFGINNLAVDFVNNTVEADTYSWDFGDGNTSTEVNPSHTYSLVGTYTVCLISTNSCGSDTSCMDITVDCPLPIAEFSLTQDELEVSFANYSDKADSYSWDFGDGNTSTEINPFHSYSAKGDYTICLITVNSCGADTICQQITLTCTDPVAEFAYQPNNLAVHFTDYSSDASRYYWNFGDGSSSQEANPLYTFADTGAYEVCLIVENVCGADTLCQTVKVECPEPVAGFTPDASGLNMIFLDRSLNATAYSWDFGDGETSKLPRPFHTFDQPGTYTVCQIVINDCGQDTLCQTVTVSCPGPKSRFDFTTNDLQVVFSSTSSTGASYTWDFGDGNSSKKYAPTHTYDTSGIYTVNLMVSTICGADTAVMEVDLSETTGISPESLLSARVYPNPSTGIFYVEIEDLPGEKIILEVHDNRGRLILTRSLNSFSNKSKETIDLQEQPKGVYFLTLRSDSKQFVQKLSVEN